jgi:hypothetical protein
MRTPILALAAASFLVLSPGSAAEAPASYPSPFGSWSKQQYSSFYFTHFSTRLALPHLRTPESRLLFRKLIDRANIEPILSSGASAEERQRDLRMILAIMGALRSSYNLATLGGEPLQEELAEVQAFNLYLAGAIADLTGGKPIDPSCSTAIKTTYLGVVTSLSESRIYSAAQRRMLTDALAKRFPLLSELFSEPERRQLIHEAAALRDQAEDIELRLALSRLASTIEGE